MQSVNNPHTELHNSPVPVGGFLASIFLLAGHDGEDGGHQGVVDTCGSHCMTRGAAWVTDREGRYQEMTPLTIVEHLLKDVTEINCVWLGSQPLGVCPSVSSSSRFFLTWSSLTGHGILLDVRTSSVCIVGRLVDPPVGPLPEQNPEEDNRNGSLSQQIEDVVSHDFT